MTGSAQSRALLDGPAGSLVHSFHDCGIQRCGTRNHHPGQSTLSLAHVDPLRPLVPARELLAHCLVRILFYLLNEINPQDLADIPVAASHHFNSSFLCIVKDSRSIISCNCIQAFAGSSALRSENNDCSRLGSLFSKLLCWNRTVRGAPSKISSSPKNQRNSIIHIWSRWTLINLDLLILWLSEKSPSLGAVHGMGNVYVAVHHSWSGIGLFAPAGEVCDRGSNRGSDCVEELFFLFVHVMCMLKNRLLIYILYRLTLIFPLT